MSGPKPQRLNDNLTAPDPSLRDPARGALFGFLNNPGGYFQQFSQPSALNQNIGNAFQNYLGQPNAATRAFESSLPAIMAQLTGTPGQGVLDAATPIHQRNQQQSADILRQSGPRFASNTERLVGEQGQRANQDFNLFTQQVMESGLQRQLGAAGLLGQLGQGADQSTLAGLTGAGQFGLGEQANQLGFMQPLMQQFFGTAFGAGGLTTQPTITQNKPWWQQALGVAAPIAGFALGGPMGGMLGAGLGSALGGNTSGFNFGGGGAAPNFGGLFGNQTAPFDPMAAWSRGDPRAPQSGTLPSMFGLPRPGSFRLG